jgi:hypothetical protein
MQTPSIVTLHTHDNILRGPNALFWTLRQENIKVKLSLCLINETPRQGNIYLHHSWLRHYLEVSGQLHIPAALPPGEKALDILWIGVCVGPKSRYGRCGGEKNLITLPGIELRSSSPYPVAMPTKLSVHIITIMLQVVKPLIIYQISDLRNEVTATNCG